LTITPLKRSFHRYPFRLWVLLYHRLKVWINPLTTPKCDDESKKFVITHPFHPLSGKEFEFVSCLNQSGEYRVHFYVEKDRLISIPAHWTNLLQEDPFVKISAGRSYFRVEDLVRLNQLIKDLKGKKDEISQMD
jgi:hypothetical protein